MQLRTMRHIVFTLFIMLVSCSEKTVNNMTDNTVTEAQHNTLVKANFKKKIVTNPPYQGIAFDVVLENNEQSDRWVLIPNGGGFTFPEKLETYIYNSGTHCGSGCVTIHEFRVEEIWFYAIQLKKEQTVTIEDLTLKYIDDKQEVGDTLKLQAIISSDFKVNDVTISDWIQTPIPEHSENAKVEYDLYEMETIWSKKIQKSNITLTEVQTIDLVMDISNR